MKMNAKISPNNQACPVLIARADDMIDRNKSTHAEKNPTKRHNKANEG